MQERAGHQAGTIAVPHPDRNTAELQASHDEYEIIAQSVCTSIAVTMNAAGWTFAVQRYCSPRARETCVQLCASAALHAQDFQTELKTWSTIGAILVYKDRPSSSAGTVADPHIGFKVYWSSTYHQGAGCGPNYCCCHGSPD